MFDFEDKKKGLTQRFAFNLRYYKSSNVDKRKDGTYEFSADPQMSFQYSKIYEDAI